MTPWCRRQKAMFFSCFFDKSWKFLSEKSGWWKRKIYKNNVFFKKVTKNDRTNFFFGNGLIEKNWWKHPIGFVISLTFEKKVITLTSFNQFSIKKKSSRILSTRSVDLDRFQSILTGKITKKCIFSKHIKCGKNVITLTISNQFSIKKIAPGSSRRDLSF